MRPSGAHTHPPSGGGIAVAVAAGAVLVAVARGHGAGHAAARAGHALSQFLTVLMWAGLAVVGLCACTAAVLVWVSTRRGRQPRQVEPGWTATVTGTGRHADGRTRPQITAPPARREVPRELHIHLPPGADPAEVARALRDAGG